MRTRGVFTLLVGLTLTAGLLIWAWHSGRGGAVAVSPELKSPDQVANKDFHGGTPKHSPAASPMASGNVRFVVSVEAGQPEQHGTSGQGQ